MCVNTFRVKPLDLDVKRKWLFWYDVSFTLYKVIVLRLFSILYVGTILKPHQSVCQIVINYISIQSTGVLGMPVQFSLCHRKRISMKAILSVSDNMKI